MSVPIQPQAAPLHACLWPRQVPPPLPACSTRLELTIICATSSAFLEKWKELACALLHMAWLTMHRLWTRQSFRAGSWGNSWLQEVCTPAPRTAILRVATEQSPASEAGVRALS